MNSKRPTKARVQTPAEVKKQARITAALGAGWRPIKETLQQFEDCRPAADATAAAEKKRAATAYNVAGILKAQAQRRAAEQQVATPSDAAAAFLALLDRAAATNTPATCAGLFAGLATARAALPASPPWPSGLHSFICFFDRVAGDVGRSRVPYFAFGALNQLAAARLAMLGTTRC